MDAKDRSKLVFSAHSLQAFADCERRFELQYIDELVWPAVETEPVLKSEQYLADGRRFHEMIQQDILGIPVTPPDANQDPEVASWWKSYQAHRPADVAGERHPEKTLVGTIGNATLVATYDLIVLTPEGKVRIFDWKTWRGSSEEEAIKKKLQSRVYPYLLTKSGGSYFGRSPIVPAAIEMVYWLTKEPGSPVTFAYNEAQYQEDEVYLAGLIEDILYREADAFPKTDDRHLCQYCPYRSFCGRGKEAGVFDEMPFDTPSESPQLMGTLDDYEAIAF